jgi:hypothetical protein
VFLSIIGLLLILKDKLVEVTFKDVLSIKTSVATATADAKTIAAIKQQVESQRATIDLVATEAQNAKNLSEDASNKIALAEQKLVLLNHALGEASNALTNLNAATEFTLLVTKAEGGDRAAYFKLEQTQFDSPTAAVAVGDILSAIATRIELETVLEDTSTSWMWNNFGIDPSKTSLQEWKAYCWNTFANNPGGRFAVIKQVFNDNRFSELEHLDFVKMVMEQDKNLVVLQEACRLMDTKRKSNQKFEFVDDYLRWYKDNRASFKTTP